MIRKQTWEALAERMKSLGISETDLSEKFILGSGSGGQKVNKTSSTVQLYHGPTKITIKCQKERSREMNRLWARRLLCDKVESELKGKKSAKAKLVHKIRKQKQKRSKRAKEKMLEDKSRLSEKKKGRLPPHEGN